MLSRRHHLQNCHHLFPGSLNTPTTSAALLHLKFLQDFRDRCSAALSERQYWNESSEYRAYSNALAANPDLRLDTARSRAYQGPESLAWLGDAYARWRQLAPVNTSGK